MDVKKEDKSSICNHVYYYHNFADATECVARKLNLPCLFHPAFAFCYHPDRELDDYHRGICPMNREIIHEEQLEKQRCAKEWVEGMMKKNENI